LLLLSGIYQQGELCKNQNLVEKQADAIQKSANEILDSISR
jgi:hypothetical protein